LRAFASAVLSRAQTAEQLREFVAILPRLQTLDDRLARIEGLLIQLSMKVDRMEQALSKLSVLTPRGQ
jgi:hypothetical protein